VYNLISQNIHALQGLFERYVNIGDKMNFNNINLSGFHKFLKDLNIIEKETSMKVINITMNTSRSPWKSSRNTSTLLSPRKAETTLNTSNIGRRLKESDAEIIFNTLCGLKHFELEKTKHLFNRNKGFSTRIDNLQFSAKIDTHRKSLAVNSTSLPGKMNFNLFLRSFENIGIKLYPYEDKANAVLQFFNQYIYKVIAKDIKSLKNSIIEMNATLKRDDIVKYYNLE
jgi:hypothetical protein